MYFYLVLKNKNIKISIKIIAGLILFLWIAVSLYRQIQSQHNIRDSIEQLTLNWTPQRIFLFILVIVLVFVNWTLEARKWQILLQGTEKFGLLKSLQSVLTGVAVSVLTPNRIGEYMGRILYLRNVNKVQGIMVTIVGSFAQLLVTGFFGLIGLSFYLVKVKSPTWLMVLLFVSLVICILMTYLFFHLSLVIQLTEKFSFLRKLKIYVEVIYRFQPKQLYELLALSVCRYMVYSIQFLILLTVCMVHTPWVITLFTIWLIFWAMAIVPTITIAEMGIRGETALYFLLPLSLNQLGIISSTVLLWLLNLIIPAMIGCLFVYKMKIYEDE